MATERHVRRFDLGEMREATRTPQGFLMVPGFATRTGVFPYKTPDGKTRLELRHPDDVLDPASLETLKYAPVTIEHPPVMLDPSNVEEYSVGHTTGRVEVNREMVDTDLIVESQEGIDAIEKDGIRELSSGYNCDIVEESGVFNGTPYDARQKNIVYNHLAMVKRGRAGPEVRMRLDSGDAIMQEPGQISKPSAGEFSQSGAANADAAGTGASESQTKTVVVAGEELDLPPDAADTIQDMLDRYDEMRAKLSQLEDEMAKRTDKGDVDVNQPGISPQVKVEQPGPDGVSAAGKIGPSDKGGVSRAKGDEDQHGVVGGEKPNTREGGAAALKDGEVPAEGQKPAADYAPAGAQAAGGGAAMSPVDRLKMDLQEMRDKMDAVQAKLDEAAAASMPAGEAKPDRADSFETRARARAKLERQAEKLVPFEIAQKFDSMSDHEIRCSVIKHRHNAADLAGKSAVYVETRFDSIVEAAHEEGAEIRKEAGRAMLGRSGRTDGAGDEPDPWAARNRMIEEGRKAHQTKLTAVKR